jgi:hypothetical protein
LQPPFGIGGMAISGGSIDKEGAAGRTTAPTAISEENEAMNKQKGIIYLAYGSNLNLEQMAYRCPNAKALGGTKLNGYRLLFRGAVFQCCYGKLHPRMKQHLIGTKAIRTCTGRKW